MVHQIKDFRANIKTGHMARISRANTSTSTERIRPAIPMEEPREGITASL